jgi:DNA polymerase-1
VQTLIDAINPHQMGVFIRRSRRRSPQRDDLSSVDPNLQNIPNRNATGRDIRSACSYLVRGSQTCSAADYSQVELRIMADLSGDEALIEGIQAPGRTSTGMWPVWCTSIPVDEVTPDQRNHVKAMSYGLAYGLSTYGLSQQLKHPVEVRRLHCETRYFQTFGKVHDYLESLVSNARRYRLYANDVSVDGVISPP